MSTDEVLSAIDHALGDWSVSVDAMRWTPTPRHGHMTGVDSESTVQIQGGSGVMFPNCRFLGAELQRLPPPPTCPRVDCSWTYTEADVDEQLQAHLDAHNEADHPVDDGPDPARPRDTVAP